MAFSTFRGLEASGGGAPPPPAFMAITPEVSAIVGAISTNSMDSPFRNQVILPSSTSQFFTAYESANGTYNLYACMVAEHGGFSATGTPTLVNAANAALSNLAADSVSSTGYLLSFYDTAYKAAYLTSSGTTLTLATSPTSIIASPSGHVFSSCCVMDSSNALVIAGSASAQDLSLISPTALTVSSTQSLAISSWNADGFTKLVGLSSTLAALFYIDSGGTTIYCSGIDRALTVVTVGSPVSITAAIGASGGRSFAVSFLTASTVIISYSKSTTVIAARVLTIAALGSVTVGAEATFTTGNTSVNNIQQSAALTSTLVLISMFEGSPQKGNAIFSVPVTISGTTITFGSSMYPTATNNSTSSVTGGAMIPISSSKAGILYYSNIGDFTGFGGSNQGYAGVLDYGNLNPTWSGTYNGTFFFAAPFTNTSPKVMSVNYLGSNRALVSYASDGTSNGGWNSVQLDTASANVVESTTGVSAALLGLQYYVIGSCRIYNDTATATRCLGYSYDGSGNVVFQVLSVAQSGAVSYLSTGTSFTNSNSLQSRPNLLGISMAPDSTLYLQGSGALVSGHYQLQASIIATSGTNVSTIGALTNVYTTTGSSFRVFPLAAEAINATTAIVLYTGDQTSVNAIYAGIIDISSGTPVLVTSALLTPTGVGYGVQGDADGGFTVGGNTGALFYYDVTNTDTIGIGFSYTTSTITVSGTVTTLVANAKPNISNNCTRGVSATELITGIKNKFYLVSMPNINTLTLSAGTATGEFANHLVMDVTENQNAVVVATWDNTGADSVIGYLYRGS